MDADELNEHINWNHITAGQVAYAIDTMPVANRWIDIKKQLLADYTEVLELMANGKIQIGHYEHMQPGKYNGVIGV